MNVQHPFQPSDTIPLDELMSLIDHEYELIRDEDAGDKFGLDVVERLNKLVNCVASNLISARDKAAFKAAVIERYIGN
ncbi:hypothetical protein [Pseudomonas savastanoi]|uniref:hypothetical protein n=1 Tax=Pseudomonas savastanoi TaxID=29438 RepID=UPI000E326307|nr:hypothetical protein [Pseudomonas savastanoi]